MADIENFSSLATHDRRAENALLIAADLDIEIFLDDVDDLVDHESHRPAAVGEHQQRLRTLAFDADVVVDANQGHKLAAILHHVATVRELDLAAFDLFQPRY